MEKNVGWLLAVLTALLLISGFTAGYVMAPEKIETITNEIIKEVPTIVTENITTVQEVEVISTDTKPLLDTAIADFLEEVEDDRTLQYCGLNSSVRYDEDQIKIKNIEDNYSINYDEDGYEVIFVVDLKYLDKDVEDKCYQEFIVSVYYEENEDPVVEFVSI